MRRRCMLNLRQTGYASSIYAAQDPADMAIPVTQFGGTRPTQPSSGVRMGGKSGIGWDT